jgi:EAL domain-containing protein (putative c-di-GMP-specific phosphodiesterase class I)
MQMEKDNNDAHIVLSTIDLAHNMGLRVVAEGVENKVIYDMLTAMSCDFVQGYFICQPVTAQNLLDVIKNHQLD